MITSSCTWMQYASSCVNVINSQLHNIWPFVVGKIITSFTWSTTRIYGGLCSNWRCKISRFQCVALHFSLRVISLASSETAVTPLLTHWSLALSINMIRAILSIDGGVIALYFEITWNTMSESKYIDGLVQERRNSSALATQSIWYECDLRSTKESK